MSSQKDVNLRMGMSHQEVGRMSTKQNSKSMLLNWERSPISGLPYPCEHSSGVDMKFFQPTLKSSKDIAAIQLPIQPFAYVKIRGRSGMDDEWNGMGLPIHSPVFVGGP